ncbi:MAG: hypothetical protein ACJ75F_09515 [Flavisolibacter sp.]|jgi:hypothetical protein
MKLIFLAAAIGAVAITSCNSNRDRYLDLNTGNYVDLKSDSAGLMVNEKTGAPVELYVDTHTHDTIFGSTGKVVNGHVTHTESGNWVVKQDGDEYKAVNGNEKIKEEGGEIKTKDGSVTKKVDEDGDVKIETGQKTIKIDGKTGERKVKKDHNITDKIKKVL